MQQYWLLASFETWLNASKQITSGLAILRLAICLATNINTALASGSIASTATDEPAAFVAHEALDARTGMSLNTLRSSLDR